VKSTPIPRLLMLAFSVAFWAYFFNSVTMAVGLMALIAVHEFGHMLAALRLGLRASWPEFTPLGAYVRVEGERSIADETYIKLAGPLLGGLASLVTMLGGFALSLPAMMEVGAFGVFLNLLNLLPLDPLDGGSFAQLLGGPLFGRFAWVFGGLVFLPVFWYLVSISSMNIVFGAFIALGAFAASGARAKQWLKPEYFQISGGKRLVMLCAYLLVAALLGTFYAKPDLIAELAFLLGLGV